MAGPSFRVPGPIGTPTRGGVSDGQLDGDPTESSDTDARGGNAPRKKKLPAFKGITRDDLLRTLAVRMVDPSKISSAYTNLCGPAALTFLAATHWRAQYSQFVTELYENGTARLGRLAVSPGTDCLNHTPNSAKIEAADWVALAGLRDSENSLFDFDDDDDAVAGITFPGTLADWLDRAGFSDVKNETNLYFTKGEDNLQAAADLYDNGYDVCLFINANLISETRESRGFFSQTVSTPDHWVVLQSPIKITGNDVSFHVFTWGEAARPVPNNGPATMPLSELLQDYYGYVAAKPTS